MTIYYRMSEDDGDSEIGAKYNPETDTYHARHKPDEPGSLVDAVIYLVSVATGKDSDTMEPLYETIDSEALESLFQSREGETGCVEFQYCGCEVTAMSDGEVVVTRTEDDD